MKKLRLSTSLALSVLLSSNVTSASDSDALVEWAVERMSIWSPPGKSFYATAKESVLDGLKRYRSIAEDARAVAFDLNEDPLFSGPYGRSKTMALLLAIASKESAFRRDVDFNIGPYARGDAGQSWCLMQIRLSDAHPMTKKTNVRVVLDGKYFKYKTLYSGPRSRTLGGEDLVANRKLCFRVGLHMIRNSMDRCKYLTMLDRLAVYTSGRSCAFGRISSRDRMAAAFSWLQSKKPPVSDEHELNFAHLESRYE